MNTSPNHGARRSRNDAGLARENARLRRERNAARQELASTQRVLGEYQVAAIEARIEGRLMLEDLERYGRLADVLDSDGRLNAWELEQQVGAVLTAQPRLALTRSGDVTPPR